MVSDHMCPKGTLSCTDLFADFANHPMMVFNMISFYVIEYVWLGFAYMATFNAAIFILTDGQILE